MIKLGYTKRTRFLLLFGLSSRPHEKKEKHSQMHGFGIPFMASMQCLLLISVDPDRIKIRFELLHVCDLYNASLGLGVFWILHHRHIHFFLAFAERDVGGAITG